MSEKEETYLPRLIDQVLKTRLNLYGAVCIEGCKWCGKSTTARRFAKSYIEMQNPATIENNRAIAATRPDLLLEGEKPRLIDEWQDTPEIWDAVRYDVDHTGLKGQYILTGSATPVGEHGKPRHSGTGRIPRLLMRPMSLYESGESTGEVSLKALFKGTRKISGISKLKLEDIALAAARGGWPESIKVKSKNVLIYARDYIDAVVDVDIQRVDGIERNPGRARALLRSLARNTMTPASNATIQNDIAMSGASTSDKTIADYLNALEKLHIVEDVPAWQPKLRSKTGIRSTKKRAMVDPSLVVGSLHATDRDLLKDFNTFGLVFEALCIRDLRVYAQANDGEVCYYRDRNGLECDAVVHLHDGKWGAIEVKLGGTEAIDEAAGNLLKFRDVVDTGAMSSPEFLMVLTATEYAYRRDDGVLVVPLGVLKA